MRCEYKDGLKVDYSGPLRISKGDEINVFIDEKRIPNSLMDDLDMALYKNSCQDMREVAETVTKTFGKKACVH